MKTFQIETLFVFCLLLGLSLLACERDLNNREPVTKSPLINPISDDVNLKDFLVFTHLQRQEIIEYSTEELFSKYELILNIYKNHKQSKAARALILFRIIEKGEYDDDKIEFLIREIDNFQTAYLKHVYLLLRRASERRILSDSQIKLYARNAYQKSESMSKNWQEHVDNNSPPSVSDDSYDASLYRLAIENLNFRDSLKIYFKGVD